MSKKVQLSQCLIEKYGISQSQANEFVDNMFRIIRERLLEEHLVKVKGLGTFKLAEMSARESININTGERITIEGRYKLSFTPENAVRDRINSPFSQFESIDMDEEMDFSDIDNNYSSDEVSEETTTEEVHEEPVTTVVEATIVEEKPVEPEESTLTEESSQTEEPILVEEPKPNHEPEPDPEPEIKTEAKTEMEAEPEIPAVDDAVAPIVDETVEKETSGVEVRSPFCENLIREEINHSRTIITMLKWLIGLIATLLVCFGMFVAYNLGKQAGREPAKITKHDVVEEIKESKPEAIVDTIAVVEQKTDSVKVEEPVKEEPKQELPNQNIYNKDARVRTGAYVITGLDTTVTVQQGQTLKGITKAYLGEGMECYVEVFNNGITSVKPGDKVKIPKVMLKKRLKQNK